MKITVIIAAFNEEKTIKSCLDSLSLQTKQPTEIIVVDDGSTDHTARIAKRKATRVLTQSHHGPGMARNFAASVANGEILVFLDADMTFDSEFIEKLVDPIEKGHSKGTINLQEYVGNYDNNLARCWSLNQGLNDHRRFNSNNPLDLLDFRAILRTEFLKVKGFDLTGYTDTHTLWRKLGYKPTPVENAVSYHNNPTTLTEVFQQARWIGKRRTKLGPVGQFINLLRYSFPVSLIVGLTKSLVFRSPHFILFKLTYDLGFSVGTVLSLVSNNSAK